MPISYNLVNKGFNSQKESQRLPYSLHMEYRQDDDLVFEMKTSKLDICITVVTVMKVRVPFFLNHFRWSSLKDIS